ncbi:Endonuclease/exonuclease/phosphatase [Gloeothece citriformis PCC 7424]|uniref:Endonuclease/exonuclease/phosphatase n=1 Tax=Gloeothece citriformis (strain PCC 7424) TaxID=65393 RepID=B7K9R3_GLOC7|nr:endonuclease/exonuclease/phosphatase family protein [Gloeothece citriformis]ACK70031.1 Endonuclease/exonuclease/phosphatase [Gloeothece citriformis PCC 7424]
MKKSIKVLRGIICLAICFTLASCTYALPMKAAPLTVMSYNVESDDINDTNPRLVAEDIERIRSNMPIDIWGLSEVLNQEAADIFTDAISSPDTEYRSILGTTGGADQLQIVYNPETVRLIDTQELRNSGGTRAPLVAHFELLGNGREFLFTVNHFNRGDEDRRNQQARFLREWGAEQTLPIVAVGDYNFDYDPQTQSGNEAFDIFLEDDTFIWIRPECLADNSCPPTGTQCNPTYNSILDFVFVSERATQWDNISDILLIDEPVCEKESRGYSDHRPVVASFDVY